MRPKGALGRSYMAVIEPFRGGEGVHAPRAAQVIGGVDAAARACHR